MTLSTMDIQAIITEGTEHRGWITNSFAQIEFLLGDLIVRCRAFPQYELHTQTVSHSAAKRVIKVRAILAIEGPMSPYADTLEPMLAAFSDSQEVRNLLAHGYCEFHHTPTGDAGFSFRKFDRAKAEGTGDDAALLEKTFRLVDLEYHRLQMIALSENAMELISNLHVAMGWADAVPQPLQ
jgi:hypothetical protein